MPFLISQARAETFPDKPVHIIIGVSPGGQVDNTARLLARQLSALWGQPVIVENRLGAAGAVANEFVAKSPPDGYTLLVVADNITAISALRTDLPYNLLRDLTPVSLLSAAPDVLVVNPSLPVRNVSELVALAKSQPGKLTYGSPGVGSLINLQASRLASMAQINIVHVPYQGSSASLIGVAGGEISMAFAAPNSVQSLAKAGKVKMLAVTSPQRWPLVPSVPTISASGVPGFSYTAWYGVFAPAGLPKDVLAALNTAVAKSANASAMKAALAKQGAEAQTDSPEQFAKFVSDDLQEKIQLVKLANLKPQQ